MTAQKICLYLVHGGPGFDDSYFYPYFNDLSSYFDIKSHTLGSQVFKDKITIEDLVRELTDNLNKVPNEHIILLGHSFGAALIIELLNSQNHLIKRTQCIIFSNWIVNNKWIEQFFQNYPETAKLEKKTCLREMTLGYLDYYFNDSIEGKNVLDKIQYNSKLYFSFSNYLTSLDLESKLSKISIPIVSISSENDAITPKSYITYNASRFKIQNHDISNAGHFPFVEATNDYNKTIINICKEYINEAL